MLPLFEAKMIHLFDTRWATYEPDGSTRLMTEEEKAERLNPMPRYWVAEGEIDKKLNGRWDQNWFLGWRRIARSTDERTLIANRLPRVALGDSIFVALASTSLDGSAGLQACLGSYVSDFILRQKMGGTNASFFLLEQFVAMFLVAGIEGLRTVGEAIERRHRKIEVTFVDQARHLPVEKRDQQ